MIAFAPYEPQHLASLDLKPAWAALRDKALASPTVPGLAYSAFKNGRPIACAGLQPHGDIAVGWAYVGRDVGLRDWVAIVKKMRSVLEEQRRPVYMTVARGFAPGCALAFRLGFVVDRVLQSFGRDGADHFLFARCEA